MVRFWNLYRKISHNVATFLESLISLLQVRTFAEVIWTEIKPGLFLHCVLFSKKIEEDRELAYGKKGTSLLYN